MINKTQLEYLKKTYPTGTRLELIEMKGESQMMSGQQGMVSFVDDAGQIHVNWDNCSTLALIMGEDQFRKISSQQKQKEVESQPKQKPDCKLTDENTNFFVLMGKALKTLRDNGQRDKAEEMTGRIINSRSHDDAISIIEEYVNIVDGEEQGFKMDMN